MFAQRISFLAGVVTTIILIAIVFYMMALNSLHLPHMEGGPAFALGVPILLCVFLMIIVGAVGVICLIVAFFQRSQTSSRWRLYVSPILLSPAVVAMVLLAIMIIKT